MASRTELQTGNVLRLTTRTQRAMHDKPTPARGHIEGSVKVGQIWIRECGVAEKHRRQGTEHGPLRVGTIQKRRHDVQVKRQVRPCGATHPETTLITTETVNIRNRNTHRSHDNTSRNSVKSQLNGSCVPPVPVRVQQVQHPKPDEAQERKRLQLITVLQLLTDERTVVPRA
jgi:hypothetical protein